MLTTVINKHILHTYVYENQFAKFLWNKLSVKSSNRGSSRNKIYMSGLLTFIRSENHDSIYNTIVARQG